MAHIRRKFDEAVKYDKGRATWAVDTIAKLYKIEKEIRGAETLLTESPIVEKRMTKASPILIELKEWMLQEYPKVLPSSPIGKAIAYALPLMDNRSGGPHEVLYITWRSVTGQQPDRFCVRYTAKVPYPLRNRKIWPI